ncbi:unnamed protein product [Cyprideis torosa]|uniref:Uncharacterized protein n=1 Tax=Cyprideis torosa TaxID=163714 RepID=A0A7R8ZFU2_9CRUS|nr:unnamed protein product [Cyprideis torosa]CAG0879953.1 unnamed protein product [Cyprideis torosa]
MNALIEKEPSGFEAPRPDDGYALSKFDGMEFSLADHHQRPELGETAPLTDVALRFKDNNSRTGGAPDQIEVSDEEGTERKEKNTRDGFRSKWGLRCHQKKHSEGNQSACALCDQPFRLLEDLEKHLKWHIHSGKPFACKTCGKAFTDRSALRRHKMIHSGEKPFACRICGKAFVWRGDLVSHQTIHTGEKPFACSICGKPFARSSGLCTHKLIHSGEKHSVALFVGKPSTNVVTYGDTNLHTKNRSGSTAPSAEKGFKAKWNS